MGVWCTRQLVSGMVCPEGNCRGSILGCVQDEEAGNEREREGKKMNQRTRLWVRTAGCMGRLPPYGEVW